MVKAEMKSPKRKSLANNTPAKKAKVENGNGVNKPFTPKLNKTPKIKQEEQPTGQKGFQKNKQGKAKNNSESPKNIKPFAGTKQLKKNPAEKKDKKPVDGADKQTLKKKRKNQFSNLINEVRLHEGSKDPEIIKKLKEKIENITSRGELSKTAKRKLSVLQKLQIICEEGSAAAAAKAKAAREATAKAKTEKKPVQNKPATTPKVTQQLKKKVKTEPIKKEEKDDEEDSDEESEEEENSDEAEAEESGDEEEDDDNDEEEDDDDDDEEEEEEEDDDEDSDEEAPAPPPKEKSLKDPKTSLNKNPESKLQESNKKHPGLNDFQNTDLLKKKKKRFVLFVGNIPYDTTKQDLAAHFSKVGDIVDIRIPTHKGINKPRGFSYIEVKDETAYEKCLSMHHSQLKGRRINVMYTQGGKKKTEDRKKDIKAKNMKLHALRKQGKLAGSVKETQKRSFRRKKKQSIMQNNSDS